MKSINESLAKNVLRLGNECRALAEENKRLKSLCDNLGMGGKHTITAIEADNARLKEENERLTEAWVDKKMQEDRDALLQQVERMTKAVMHSPAAQLKLKELEGKTTYDEINPDNQ